MKFTEKDFQDLVTRVEKAEEIAAKYSGLATQKLANGVSGDNGNYHIVGNRSNSVESRTLSYFGGNIKKLCAINIGDQTQIPMEYKAVAMDLKHTIANARAIAQLFYDAPMDSMKSDEKGRVRALKHVLETRYGKEVLEPKLKAFTTTSFADWVPTLVADFYVTEFELAREVVAQLRQVNMPSSPYELPKASGLTVARGIAEGTTATVSNPTDGKITFTARKFVEYYEISEEITEDSAPDVLNFARMELAEAHQRAFETAVVNGDRDGTHQDSDTQAGAADLAEKQLDGLRKYALGNSANGGTVDFANSAVTDAKLREMVQNADKLGIHPQDGLWIASPIAYNQMKGTDNVVTVDKIGDRATVMNGTLSNYAGVPIVVSGFVRKDMADTGVYDGVTTDRTGLLYINKRRWYFGTRRPIRMAIRPARSADDQYEMASYSRVDMQGHTQSADEVGVVYGIDVPA